MTTTRTTSRWGARRLLAGVLLVLLTASLAVGCSDDESADDGPDDSVQASAEGEATGPTVAPGGTVTTAPPPEIPDPPPIPAVGQATLALDGEPIEVELNRCEYDPVPEIGLDVTMNPPGTTQENPAGLVLLVPGAQPGPNLVDSISAALQLPGDPTFLPLEGRLDLAEDLLSGTLIFQVVRGEQAQIGTAAFHCDPAASTTTTAAP